MLLSSTSRSRISPLLIDMGIKKETDTQRTSTLWILIFPTSVSCLRYVKMKQEEAATADSSIKTKRKLIRHRVVSSTHESIINRRGKRKGS